MEFAVSSSRKHLNILDIAHATIDGTRMLEHMNRIKIPSLGDVLGNSWLLNAGSDCRIMHQKLGNAIAVPENHSLIINSPQSPEYTSFKLYSEWESYSVANG